MRFSGGIQHLVSVAPATIGHFALWTFWRLVVLAAAYLALSALLSLIRERLGRKQRDLITISPSAGSDSDSSAWPDFFRGLAAVCPPWWKRAVFGVPWLSFEFESTWGQVVARCGCPRHLTALVTSSLRAAVPGVQVDVADHADLPLAKMPAARARLALWREPLYPLSQAHLDPLAAGLGALAATPGGIVQWQADLARMADAITEHRQANRSYISEGIRLLDLASRAADMFRNHEGDAEKRELLRFVVAESSWRDGELTATLRQPFDLISAHAGKLREADSSNEGGNSHGRLETLSNSSKRPNPNTARGSKGRSNAKSEMWSGRRDLNPRPPAPKAGTLPGCATPRDRRNISRPPSSAGPGAA